MPATALRRILVVEHRPNTRSLVGFSLGKLYGVVRGLEAGADGYISKSSGAAALTAALGKMLGD